ncbi:hypothetical protein FEQ05_06588 [Burkholderia pseudomultivorans]|nr:hypothetical protein [Burkholderia pseudomultivorans]MDR8853389.1 hypothetical protein [Burkholderia pseudomultivorans]
MQHERRARGDDEHGQRPAQPRRGVGRAREHCADARHVADRDVRAAQVRQHEARDERGGRQPDDRIQPELHEARKAGEQHRREAADGGQHAEPDRRPVRGKPRARRVGRARRTGLRRLHEQVDRVVDGLADQRRAEAEREPMHGAEHDTDRRDAGRDAGQHRQQAQRERARRAVKRQQQRDDQHDARTRQAFDVVPDRVARLDREHARARHRERAGGRVRQSLRRGGECAAHRVDRACLRIGVGAGGGRLHDEHRARAVARCPDAVADRRLRAAVELVDERADFAGRVARQQVLRDEAGGRAQQVEAVAERLVQAGGGEALRRDRRAQQVAMLEDELPVARVVHRFAVVDRRELRIGAQRGGHAPRQRRTRGRVAAVDRDQDQPRHDAVAQLIDQHLLAGARRARQERGQVGREARAADRDPARDEREQPYEHRALPQRVQAARDGRGPGALVHQLAGTGCRRISE